MKHFAKRLLCALLCAVLLAGFFLCRIPKAEAAHYSGYGTVAVIQNQGDCYAMQGCDSDDTYIYCTKVNTETETSAVIARVHKDTGATTFLTNSATGTYYFSQLAHANDLEVVDINGVKTIFVATGTAGRGPYSLVRLALSGTTLTEVAHYDMQYNGASQRIGGAQVVSVEGDSIHMLFLWSSSVFTATIGVDQATGKVPMELAFHMDFTDININGTQKDLSAYVKQGFEYYDGKIYVPLDGEPNYDVSSVTAWDVIGASGTIKNNPNFSVWIQDTTFVDLFEIESVTICPSDGKMYFSTNRRKTSSDGNWDGVHYLSNFIYDPSVGDNAAPANFRWNASGGELFSSNQNGCEFNHAQIIKGTVSGNAITKGQYSLDRTVVLKHTVPWVLEWKASNVKNAMLMSTAKKSGYEGNRYLYVRTDGLVSLGNASGGSYHNYGLNITDFGYSTTDAHTYRLENRIASDGTNMVYLKVDGKELGAMNRYFIGGTAQGTTDSWVSGKDFKFSYLGTTQHPITGNYSHIIALGNGAPGKDDEPNTLCWNTTGNALTPLEQFDHTAVAVTRLFGSVSGTAYTGYQGKLGKNLTLLHTRPWTVEWTGAASGMLLATSPNARVERSSFLYRSSVIAFGRWNGTQYDNYGVKPADHGIDVSLPHTYRLTNRIHADGSNMVYLYVDGKEIAPMDTYFIGSAQQSTGSDWISGKDFSFPYFGTYQFPVAGQLSQIRVWEDGIPAEQIARQYHWTPGSNTMTSSATAPYTQNTTTLLGGSNTASAMNDCWFRLDRSVVLLHNRAWTLQWESSGSWQGSSTGAFLLSASQYSNELNAPYLYRRSNSDLIALGVRANERHNNYGVCLADYGIDGTAPHTYKLVNRIRADGSNMVYLHVDGKEIAPMNTYFNGGTNTGTTDNWVSGKDFVFSYMGTPRFPIGACTLNHMQVNEGCTHSYGSWTVTAEATCDREGSRTRSCSLCGVEQTEVIPATGHSYQSQVTAPTCSSGGYTTYTCSSCGHSYTGDYTDAGTHSYSATVIDPTCTTGGYTSYRCSLCGDSYQADSTPAAGHDYSSLVTQPTCSAQGYTVYSCKSCGSSYTGSYTDATGHSYRATVVAPTCTAQGYTVYTCGSCGHSYKDQYTVPQGHSYKAVTVAPTCTTGGYTVYTCTCGDTYTADLTQASGHSYANGSCTACGVTDPDYRPGVTQPTLTLKSPTLEFRDMICINAFYTAENIQDVVEMGMITYDENVTVWNVETADHVIPGASYDESTGRYYSRSQGIFAKYLADTVYLAIYARLSDGSCVYSKLASYSAVTYATNQLKNSTDVSLKQLVVAMLNYGAEAQAYFGRNTGSLANASLTAEQQALPEAYRSDMVQSVPATSAAKQGSFANNQGFASRKPAISFEGAFCINYFFTPNYTPDQGITLYYWNAADYNAASVLTTANASGSLQLSGSGTGEYRGDITGIAAKAISEAVYVAAVYESGGTTWTSGVLGYSIGAYCSSQAAKGGSVAALARATAVYGYHAKQYFGS